MDCQLPLAHQMSVDKFVQQAGRKGLVGNAFFQGACLQVLEVSGRYSDVQALVFFEARFGYFAMCLDLLGHACKISNSSASYCVFGFMAGSGVVWWLCGLG